LAQHVRLVFEKSLKSVVLCTQTVSK